MDHLLATQIRRADVRPILTRLALSERLGLSDMTFRPSSAFSAASEDEPDDSTMRV